MSRRKKTRGFTSGYSNSANTSAHRLILENLEALARILTAEQGKPLSESRTEIAYAASFVEWFSEEAKRIYGDVIAAQSTEQRILVLKQPIGVCVAITPWNFPAAMITRKAAAALAAGCTLVIKPASQTPLTAFALCELAVRAGIPPGVLSCITGSASEIGDELTTNPLVKKLSFTGSTEIGKKLLAQCASTVKATSMELGGNAPFIVFEDANLDRAVEGAIASKFRNSGQTCVCSNRFLIHEKVYEPFLKKMTAATAALRVGNGFDPETQIGPLIDKAAVKNIQSMLADAVSKGAKILVGGKASSLGETFFEPTVLSDATPDMQVFQEEIFGPVAPIATFKSEADAIQLANSTPYGLAAYFYGQDLNRIFRVAEALEYGMIGINESRISTEVAPFGGIKQSGHGREGSKYGINDYIEIKYLCMGGIRHS
ncbi:NAD-dependent succinate-semialdehyde dehydrogenase [Spongiibacter sp. KMU-158]|uniref:NAD-dependent succinate-semialdehyde dehydrogenase n=1 Tax=Spongiibacter pelagi TaxID=2760804 RepID=A0A927GYB3_9GAMM|nr:NAD-dependent succinate-semialdehyde dehydrogenase [Spongiibacter pelagi]